MSSLGNISDSNDEHYEANLAKKRAEQRPFSESRSGRNGRNVKREKRQESPRKRGWKRRPRNWRKKINAGNKKNNARRIWPIDLKRTALPPLSNNGTKIG